MRKKIPDLAMALAGRFGAHHALLARMHLEQVDQLSGMIQRLDDEIDQVVAPFSEQVGLLRTIPGIGERTAQVLIREIGVDMSRFPTADHLASWAGLCPGNNESAGTHQRARTRKGNREVREALVEAAWLLAGPAPTWVPGSAGCTPVRQARRQQGSRRDRPQPAGDRLVRPARRCRLPGPWC